MHRQAQKDAGPQGVDRRLIVMAVGMAAHRRRGFRIGSGLPSGESPPAAVPGGAGAATAAPLTLLSEAVNRLMLG